jgi:hypothetical protein
MYQRTIARSDIAPFHEHAHHQPDMPSATTALRLPQVVASLLRIARKSPMASRWNGGGTHDIDGRLHPQ